MLWRRSAPPALPRSEQLGVVLGLCKGQGQGGFGSRNARTKDIAERDEKQRFFISSSWIRAAQGHSVKAVGPGFSGFSLEGQGA